jgi:hypothetical protein
MAIFVLRSRYLAGQLGAEPHRRPGGVGKETSPDRGV